jgi:hypothetical protein
MPNPHAHIALAEQAAKCLPHPVLQRHLGAFLLGCTAPDIRVITRSGRDETHFATIDAEGITSGVKGFFRANPELADPKTLSGPTCAFVAGYCSHLLADQTWIAEMYRPFFGNVKVYEDVSVGNVMDRALQMEMDRQAYDTVQGLRHHLVGSEDGIEVGFIDKSTLSQWCQWVEDALARSFSWERLRSIGKRRQAEADYRVAELAVEEFLKDVTLGMRRIYQRVPRRCLEEYRNSKIRSFVTVVGGYLGCA